MRNKFSTSTFFFIFLLNVFVGINNLSAKNQLPKDILAQLNQYNVTWKTLSTTGSMESMPIGNGDITANVWIEKDGDLMMYIGKSDTWSEATRLLKVGRVRISIAPNPFIDDVNFIQTLNLYEGAINVSAGKKGNATRLKIWIDANQQVVRVEVSSDKDVSIECTTELLRPTPFTLISGDDPIASSFRGLLGSPVKPSESADVLLSKPNQVQWYHRNETSFYETILTKQNVPELAQKYPDPYLYRTFGASMLGKDLVKKDDATLVSAKPGKQFAVSIYPYTAQTASVADWENQLAAQINTINKQDIASAKKQHQLWWDAFWNRSWVFLSGDADAEAVTQAYLLQRFMMACQSRGAYPAKFNGGNFTFDFGGQNGDYRNWGPGYWFQNNRLFHWPLFSSGDYDLLKPWFDMYMNVMKFQKDVTKKQHGHGGAFFPETLNFFGLFIQDDWGWNNVDGKASDTRWIRYHYSSSLEMLSQMLELYDYTKDDEFAKQYIIPFAEQSIRFFDQHWPRISGVIRFSPANSLEQFWDCVNPVDYIAGLQYTIGKLNELPRNLTTSDLLEEWNNCLRALPPLPMSSDKKKILPAEEFGEERNFENPECYPIFPFRLFGLERPGLDIAKNTFDNRVWKLSNCWSQCLIQAALLGLGEESGEFIMKNVTAHDPGVRFPAFWKQGSDYNPDFDNGGVMATGLQYMLIQNVNDKILVLPAFPAHWNVDFKLQAHDNTTVRVKSAGTVISQLEVSPVSRKADVSLSSKYSNTSN